MSLFHSVTCEPNSNHDYVSQAGTFPPRTQVPQVSARVWECPSKVMSATLEPGDIIVVNTNWWMHSTTVVGGNGGGGLSFTITKEYT